MSTSETKRILLATDFSKPAQRAYAYAVKLATAFAERMVILNVLEGPPGLDREFPINALYLKQLQEEADRGLTGTSRFLLGSVSDGVIKYAPCAVLVFRR